uniref:hypothetical protein n=1 Tax=Phenylobacterium sp. TaxID=1871053 RepID=UPI002623B425
YDDALRMLDPPAPPYHGLGFPLRSTVGSAPKLSPGRMRASTLPLHGPFSASALANGAWRRCIVRRVPEINREVAKNPNKINLF